MVNCSMMYFSARWLSAAIVVAGFVATRPTAANSDEFPVLYRPSIVTWQDAVKEAVHLGRPVCGRYGEVGARAEGDEQATETKIITYYVAYDLRYKNPIAAGLFERRNLADAGNIMMGDGPGGDSDHGDAARQNMQELARQCALIAPHKPR